MDKFSKAKRSKIMSAITSKNTKPEILLRHFLWKKGVRFRLHYGKEKIDIALPGKRIAIFVDGCFWHQCPKHSHIPKSNKQYWIPKLRKNILRARRKDAILKEQGWEVIHVWEHEFEDLTKTGEKVLSKI
jgi:DNA mismatch endonuclease (patch repair protein)